MPTDRGMDRAKSVARAMGWIGTAVNAVAVMAVLVTTLRLWGWSGDYLTRAGGLPPIDPGLWFGLVQEGDIAQRMGWWALAWISLVGSGACALLTIAGLHWAWHTIRNTLIDGENG